MRLIFRYLLGALVALVGLTAVGITRYPDYRFIDYVPEILLLGSGVIIISTVFSITKEDELTDRGKTVLLHIFLIAVLVPTAYSAGAYVHQSATSWSNGEIHWHADFEIFVQGDEFPFQPSDTYDPVNGDFCQQLDGDHLCQLDLIDPGEFCKEMSEEHPYMCRLNDRVGATEYHEHNDMRIHLEGTFKHREEATLAAFFETFDGTLTNDELRFPTNDDTVHVTDGDGKSLKILIQQGVGGDRDWCAIAENVAEEDRCVDMNTGQPATSPADYVISPFQRGAILDVIYVVYDDVPVDEALDDVREDDEYRGMGVFKAGEGY